MLVRNIDMGYSFHKFIRGCAFSSLFMIFGPFDPSHFINPVIPGRIAICPSLTLIVILLKSAVFPDNIYGKAETYSEPSHTSKMELFAKIVNN